MVSRIKKDIRKAAPVYLSLACLLVTACITYGPPPTPSAADNKTVSVQNLQGTTQTPGSLLTINSFLAQPKHLRQGESSTLTWDVTGATAVTIEPNVGSVSSNTGSARVSPMGTTLYSLKATNGAANLESRFLVIVKSVDGKLVWPEENPAEPGAMYEGWISYPNKFVDWIITDQYRAPYSNADTCWHIGVITNNHPNWMMTEITILDKMILTGVLPESKRAYTISMDCNLVPELKWRWEKYK